MFINKLRPRSSLSLWLDPTQKMGIDIISWRRRIAAYTPRSVTSPTRHTVPKTKPTSRSFVTTRNNQDTSFLYIFSLFILISAGIHVLALQHTTHRTPRRATHMKVFRPLVNKANLSSATLLPPTWNSVTYACRYVAIFNPW